MNFRNHSSSRESLSLNIYDWYHDNMEFPDALAGIPIFWGALAPIFRVTLPPFILAI